MMFFVIIIFNIDFGIRFIVRIYVIYVLFIIWYYNLLSIYYYGNVVFIITYIFFGGRGWWLKGVMGVGN